MHKSVFSSRVRLRRRDSHGGNETFMEIRDLSLIPTVHKNVMSKIPMAGH